MFEVPESCRECHVETAPARRGGGFWLQHNNESRRFETDDAARAWLAELHARAPEPAGDPVEDIEGAPI